MTIRTGALIVISSGVLLAQTPGPAEPPSETPPPKQETPAPKTETPPPALLRDLMRKSFALTVPTVCAIPLLRVGPIAKTAPMPQIKAPEATDYTIRLIHPPAPACGEQKK